MFMRFYPMDAALGPIELHPALVHFPIAFFFLECFLLFLWRAKKRESYREFAFLAMKAGYAFLLPAMIAGYLDSGGWPMQGTVRLHFFAALAVFALYTVRILYWKKMDPAVPAQRNLLLISALAGSCLVVLTAFLGGTLVYS